MIGSAGLSWFEGVVELASRLECVSTVGVVISSGVVEGEELGAGVLTVGEVEGLTVGKVTGDGVGTTTGEIGAGDGETGVPVDGSI